MSYAWFIDNTVPKVTGEITWHAVAVIDIPRHQMHKHKDAAWLFDACGIDPAALLFADEVLVDNLTTLAMHMLCTECQIRVQKICAGHQDGTKLGYRVPD